MLAEVVWTAKRTTSNIVELRAETEITACESDIVKEMFRFIKVATKLKGVPYQEPIDEESNYKLLVFCSIIFPNDVACCSFIEKFPM